MLFGNQKRGYKKVLNEGDFTVSDHQVLTSTTEWTTIATYQCPAQQKIYPGYGDENHPENEGRVYIYLRTGETTPAEITGKVRIIVTDYNETKIIPIDEFDEELTHGDLNDKKKMIPLPQSGFGIAEDSYIKIQVKPDSAHSTAGAGNDNLGWADSTESLLKIPVTIFQ